MCADLGPTSVIFLPDQRTSEPPATPATLTSSDRMQVGCCIIVTYRTSGLPSLIAHTLVDVPPTSINTPSIRRRCSRAPATLAAGPDRTVTIGLLLKVPISVTPPSPFIIRTGALIFSFLTADSTKFAVLVVLGRIPPLIAAV